MHYLVQYILGFFKVELEKRAQQSRCDWRGGGRAVAAERGDKLSGHGSLKTVYCVLPRTL